MSYNCEYKTPNLRKKKETKIASKNSLNKTSKNIV